MYLPLLLEDRGGDHLDRRAVNVLKQEMFTQIKEQLPANVSLRCMVFTAQQAASCYLILHVSGAAFL